MAKCKQTQVFGIQFGVGSGLISCLICDANITKSREVTYLQIPIFTARDLVILWSRENCKLKFALWTIFHYSSHTACTVGNIIILLVTLCLAIFCVNLELGSVSTKDDLLVFIWPVNEMRVTVCGCLPTSWTEFYNGGGWIGPGLADCSTLSGSIHSCKRFSLY